MATGYMMGGSDNGAIWQLYNTSTISFADSTGLYGGYAPSTNYGNLIWKDRQWIDKDLELDEGL